MKRFLKKSGGVPPSRIYERLEPVSYEAILAIMAKSASKTAEKRISDFLTKYNGMRLRINGGDLEAIGVREGPGYRKILTAALRAKLDRGFATKRQETGIVATMATTSKTLWWFDIQT